MTAFIDEISASGDLDGDENLVTEPRNAASREARSQARVDNSNRRIALLGNTIRSQHARQRIAPETAGRTDVFSNRFEALVPSPLLDRDDVRAVFGGCGDHSRA